MSSTLQFLSRLNHMLEFGYFNNPRVTSKLNPYGVGILSPSPGASKAAIGIIKGSPGFTAQADGSHIGNGGILQAVLAGNSGDAKSIQAVRNDIATQLRKSRGWSTSNVGRAHLPNKPLDNAQKRAKVMAKLGITKYWVD